MSFAHCFDSWLHISNDLRVPIYHALCRSRLVHALPLESRVCTAASAPCAACHPHLAACALLLAPQAHPASCPHSAPYRHPLPPPPHCRTSPVHALLPAPRARPATHTLPLAPCCLRLRRTLPHALLVCPATLFAPCRSHPIHAMLLAPLVCLAVIAPRTP